MAGSGGRCEEMRCYRIHDRQRERLLLHLDERHPLGVAESNGIEGDIDAPGCSNHFAEVVLYRSPLERIDLSDLSHSSRVGDVLRHGLKRSQGATGKEDLRSLAGEGAGNRTADGSSRSVDDRVLLLK